MASKEVRYAYVHERQEEYYKILDEIKREVDPEMSNFQLEVLAHKVNFLSDLVYVIEDAAEFADDRLMPILLEKNLTLEDFLNRWLGCDFLIVEDIRDFIRRIK